MQTFTISGCIEFKIRAKSEEEAARKALKLEDGILARLKTANLELDAIECWETGEQGEMTNYR